jgi:Flp pilus assembly pilin Flp
VAPVWVDARRGLRCSTLAAGTIRRSKERKRKNGNGGTRMNLIRKLYVKANELARGQTMTEYALILAAVAVVVYAGYQTMGTTINALLTTVDGQL